MVHVLCTVRISVGLIVVFGVWEAFDLKAVRRGAHMPLHRSFGSTGWFIAFDVIGACSNGNRNHPVTTWARERKWKASVDVGEENILALTSLIFGRLITRSVMVVYHCVNHSLTMRTKKLGAWTGSSSRELQTQTSAVSDRAKAPASKALA